MYTFNPIGGISQIRYSCEWASAYWQLKAFYKAEGRPFPEHQIDLGESSYNPPSSFTLDDFENHAQPVHPVAEGFSTIEYASAQIFSLCEPFHRTALIIEAHSIFSFRHVVDETFQVVTNYPAKELKAVLGDWLHRAAADADAMSEPRVILLVDERILFPAYLETDAADPVNLSVRISALREEFKLGLTRLAFDHPIFAIVCQYGTFDERSFFSIPNAGMIAWIQHRHRLDLSRCFYVRQIDLTSTNSGGAKIPAGLNYIASDDFFSPTGWDAHSKLRKNAIPCKSTALPFLSDIQFLSYLPEPPKYVFLFAFISSRPLQAVGARWKSQRMERAGGDSRIWKAPHGVLAARSAGIRRNPHRCRSNGQPQS